MMDNLKKYTNLSPAPLTFNAKINKGNIFFQTKTYFHKQTVE